MKRNHSEIIKVFSKLISVLFFVLVFTALAGMHSAYAASLSVTKIDYVNDEITVKSSAGDTKIWYSDNKGSSWEEVPGGISNGEAVLDISWASASSKVNLWFKGNKSTEAVQLVLPKQYTKFKASYKKATGSVVFSGDEGRSIQWRKKESSRWKTVNKETFSSEISGLLTKGGSIVLRLAPVNGTSASEVGMRASREVTLSIPKKSDAPSVSIDDGKLAISVKAGMAYRYVYADGSTSAWKNIEKSEYIPLATIAPNSMKPGNTTITCLQFRTNATSSKQVSKVKTIEVPAQEDAPDAENIKLSYTGSSTLTLTIEDASASEPYEYVIVKEGDKLDLLKASWSTISTKNAVTISSKLAPEGSQIYVRRKAVQEKDDTPYTLASAYVNVSGTGVDYPAPVTSNGLITLSTVSGVCRTDVADSALTFTLYSPTKATVSSVEFINSETDAKVGTVTVKSTAAKNDAAKGDDDRYIITTKITSTENVDSCIDKLMYANITLNNGDSIKSKAGEGVALYIHSPSKVSNPSGKEYQTSFDRIFLSTEEDDETSFKFRVVFGEKFLYTKNGNVVTSDTTGISSLKYDGYTLTNSDYSVLYGSEDETFYADITVDVSRFEASSSIKVRDEYESLDISLNSGERIKGAVKIKLVSTAELLEKPLAYAITAGSLKETEVIKTTLSDGTVQEITSDVISIALSLQIFDASYGVTVSDVTWNGISVYDSATVSAGKATVYLSNKKLNKLTSASSTTANLVITMSNGFVISQGCKLTVVKGE